jgi:hypothetical protein
VPAPTGIDYLRLIDAAHDAALGGRVNYAALTDTGDLGQTASGDDDTDGHDAA